MDSSVFSDAAGSMMKITGIPQEIMSFRKIVQKYIAECLARTTINYSLTWDSGDYREVSLRLILPYVPHDEIVEDPLEKTEDLTETACLNRFTGIDLDE